MPRQHTTCRRHGRLKVCSGRALEQAWLALGDELQYWRVWVLGLSIAVLLSPVIAEFLYKGM
jgi:hypothetical protein